VSGYPSGSRDSRGPIARAEPGAHTGPMLDLVQGRLLWAAAVFLSVFSFGRAAEALEPCADGGTCPKNFVCNVWGGCEPYVCFEDADCDVGFRCEFPGGACWRNARLPCARDADCGDGFSCAASALECNCSGDVSPPADAAITPISCDLPIVTRCNDPNCTRAVCDAGAGCVCWTDFFCKELPDAGHACTDDSSCLAGWTCACAAGDDDAACLPFCHPPGWDNSASDAPAPNDTVEPTDPSDAGDPDATVAPHAFAGDALTPTRGAGCNVTGSPGPAGWVGVALSVLALALGRRGLQPRRAR